MLTGLAVLSSAKEWVKGRQAILLIQHFTPTQGLQPKPFQIIMRTAAFFAATLVNKHLRASLCTFSPLPLPFSSILNSTGLFNSSCLDNLHPQLLLFPVSASSVATSDSTLPS